MRKRVVAFFLLGLFAAVTPTRADPVQVTSGVFTGSDSSVNDFLIFGPGLTLAGIAGSDLLGEPHWRCGLCQAGAQVSLSSRYVTFEGIEYNGTAYQNVTGVFSFMADAVSVPNPDAAEVVHVRGPFTFLGQLSGLGITGTLDLNGRGIVSVSFVGRPASNQEPAHVDIPGTDYRFAADPAPVPEPATLLLVGGALAGALARRRMRTRREPAIQAVETADLLSQ